MTGNEFEKTLQEIGRLMAAAVGGEAEGAFLYAETDAGFVAADLFKDFGDRVVYYSFGEDLAFAVMDAWEMTEPAKRWTAMHYSIADGRFEVRFDYPEDGWNEDETFDQRSDRVIAAKYGNRPIEYPPFGPKDE